MPIPRCHKLCSQQKRAINSSYCEQRLTHTQLAKHIVEGMKINVSLCLGLQPVSQLQINLLLLLYLKLGSKWMKQQSSQQLSMPPLSYARPSCLAEQPGLQLPLPAVAHRRPRQEPLSGWKASPSTVSHQEGVLIKAHGLRVHQALFFLLRRNCRVNSWTVRDAGHAVVGQLGLVERINEGFGGFARPEGLYRGSVIGQQGGLHGGSQNNRGRELNRSKR